MSLLQQEDSDRVDDVAPGESFTKGTTHLVWATIVATVVVTVAIAAYVIAGQKPPAAAGEILEVWVHPMHTVTAGFDANGTSVPQETIDQILVFTRVRLHNQSKQPIFLHQIMTDAALSDGVHSSYAAMPKDYDRIFIAYPQLAQWRSTPISPDTQIDPDKKVEGTFVSSFHMAKEDWDQRKDLSFTFAFRYLPQLNLHYAGAITVR